MLTTLYKLLVLSLALATVLPGLNARHWTIRGQEFPRIQYAALSVVLLLILLVWQHWSEAPSILWAALLAPVAGWHLYGIWPYTRFHRTEVPPAESHTGVQKLPRLRVLSSNVLMHNRQAQRLIDQVVALNPDILITLESDGWWQVQLDAALTDWSHRVACPLDNLYGMHLYSRLPLDSARVEYRVARDIPSISARLRIGPEQRLVHLYVIHPTPPAPGENTYSTERDIELLRLADEVAENDLPVIVAGDLNDVAWSRTTQLFRQVSGLLDPRIGRGAVNTFHAKFSWIRWPLDHVFRDSHSVPLMIFDNTSGRKL